MKKLTDLAKELSGNNYPGRGIIIGKAEDGLHMAIAYFIMGRSENSCNRVFVEEGAGIRTQAHDPAKLSDPSLVIYAPVRVLGEHTIVTNGDQTDTIYEMMQGGKTFEDALRTRTFEPDPPNYTPRISGIVTGECYKLSILKSSQGNPDSVQRYFFEYTPSMAGEGHFIHTYQQDGNPLPSFQGEPEPVAIKGGLDEFTRTVWENLNAEKKVSLFTRFINLQTGETDTRILNKNLGD